MNSSLSDRLTSFDASALAQEIAARRLTARAVVDAHFTRIEHLNKEFNALVTLDKAGAISRDELADEDLARGTIWGPLHGVPITIKDCLLTQGIATTVGHRDFTQQAPSRDAWIVTRLKQAGAIVLGKTSCATLCGGVQTSNAIFGTTSNPWDLKRTAGGSSGGELRPSPSAYHH